MKSMQNPTRTNIRIPAKRTQICSEYAREFVIFFHEENKIKLQKALTDNNIDFLSWEDKEHGETNHNLMLYYSQTIEPKNSTLV